MAAHANGRSWKSRAAQRDVGWLTQLVQESSLELAATHLGYFTADQAEGA